jgi:hypothetical protein
LYTFRQSATGKENEAINMFETPEKSTSEGSDSQPLYDDF